MIKNINKVDVKGGKMTYMQRIKLGQILSDSSITNVQRFDAVFECLHGKKPSLLQYEKLLKYYNDIVDGIIYWSKLEEDELYYEPSEDEKRAGIKEYQDKVGDLSSVNSLAKNYSKDPDEILMWQYAKVFGIFVYDLESYKYQKRFSKVITSKH